MVMFTGNFTKFGAVLLAVFCTTVWCLPVEKSENEILVQKRNTNVDELEEQLKSLQEKISQISKSGDNQNTQPTAPDNQVIPFAKTEAKVLPDDSGGKNVIQKHKDLSVPPELADRNQISNGHFVGQPFGNPHSIRTEFQPVRANDAVTRAVRSPFSSFERPFNDRGTFKRAPFAPVKRAPFGPFKRAPFGPFKRAPFGPFKRAPFGPFKRAPFGPFKRSPFVPVKRYQTNQQVSDYQPEYYYYDYEAQPEYADQDENIINGLERHLMDDLNVAKQYGVQPEQVLADLRQKQQNSRP